MGSKLVSCCSGKCGETLLWFECWLSYLWTVWLQQSLCLLPCSSFSYSDKRNLPEEFEKNKWTGSHEELRAVYSSPWVPRTCCYCQLFPSQPRPNLRPFPERLSAKRSLISGVQAWEGMLIIISALDCQDLVHPQAAFGPGGSKVNCSKFPKANLTHRNFKDLIFLSFFLFLAFFFEREPFGRY